MSEWFPHWADGASAQLRGGLAGEDDLAGGFPVEHRPEPLRGFGKCKFRADLWPDAGQVEVGEQVGELVTGAHGGAGDAQLEEEDALQLRVRVRAAGRAGDHDDPARLERFDRMRPGRLADRLEHGV